MIVPWDRRVAHSIGVIAEGDQGGDWPATLALSGIRLEI